MAVIPVTRFDDPVPDGCLVGDCSLREAIIEANANPGMDTVQLSSGTYTLTLGNAEADDSGAATGDLDVSDVFGTTSVVGIAAEDTAIVVDGTSMNNRIFDVIAGAGLEVRQLTIRGGTATAGLRDGEIVGGKGGAIQAIDAASLTLTEVVLADNRADEQGGALYVENGFSAGGVETSVEIQRSTIHGNSATSGGGWR